MPTSELCTFLGYPIVKTNVELFLFEDVIEFIKQVDFIPHADGSLSFSNDAHILQNEKLKDLRQIIWNSFCSYVDNVLEVENEFYLCNSWCTYQKTNQFHPPHNHSNAIFSSVLYLQTEESELQFINNKSKIQEGFNFEYKVKNFNYFNSANWSMPVEQGDLLIFPGELNHRTFPYQGQKERIVIGCSYFLQGELGNDSNYNSINIQNNHTKY